MVLITHLCLLLAQQATGAAAQASAESAMPEQSIRAVYQRMEQADRTGDSAAWFVLRDRKTVAAMAPGAKEAIAQSVRARPSVQYEPLSVRVNGDRAILLGRVTDSAARTVQYQIVLFAIEEGQWKVSREEWSEKPSDPFVLYALLPPQDGAFSRAGSPWRRVSYVLAGSEASRKEELVWKIQATVDEAFVYLRFEAANGLPQAGSRVKPELADIGKTGAPPPPPPIRIKVNDREFTIAVSDLLSTNEGATGKPKSAVRRASVSYALSVKDSAGGDIFTMTAGDESTDRLLAIQGRFIDVRLPMIGMGGRDDTMATIVIERRGSVQTPSRIERFAAQ